MDFVLSEEFDQMPASEFFGTLKALGEALAWLRLAESSAAKGWDNERDAIHDNVLFRQGRIDR